jgi:phenylalanyl-tRNA synthetase alpha chain
VVPVDSSPIGPLRNLKGRRRMIERVEELREESLRAFAEAADAGALEAARIRYLGRKQGAWKDLLEEFRALPGPEKATVGKPLNLARKAVQDAFDARRKALAVAAPKPAAAAPQADVTLPGRPVPVGTLHPVTLVLRDIRRIFENLGFEVVRGPEVETEFYNFDALNIPPDHPARSDLDNFFISDTTLLRSQTSPVQIRVMEKRKPPLRIIAPGRVYRPETVDATHLYQFHQVEGLMVGEAVTFADLKAVLNLFARSFYGPSTRTRFRPHFFPFTETSAEMDVFVEGRGWMEILGCGMVDPNVFDAVGYDAERYTGFAFGMGVERIAMRKYGIDDIRLLVENDVRFLEQF